MKQVVVTAISTSRPVANTAITRISMTRLPLLTIPTVVSRMVSTTHTHMWFRWERICLLPSPTSR